MDIFEGYMEIQYNEGKKAKEEGKDLLDNPYEAHSEMGQAWIDGWSEAVYRTD